MKNTNNKIIKENDTIITTNNTQYYDDVKCEMAVIPEGTIAEVISVSNYRTYTVLINGENIVIKDVDAELY